jgi:chemotaxis protein CheX
MVSAGSSNLAASSAGWRANLADAAMEVFAMMVGPGISRASGKSAPDLPNVTGMVGIAGAVRAVFTLRCSAQSATKIASQMLGVSILEAAAQQCDAMGEICNIVAGQFKAKIGLEDKCMLSVPTVFVGGDYQVHSVSNSDRLEVTLLFEGKPILLVVEVRN